MTLWDLRNLRMLEYLKAALQRALINRRAQDKSYDASEKQFAHPVLVADFQLVRLKGHLWKFKAMRLRKTETGVVARKIYMTFDYTYTVTATYTTHGCLMMKVQQLSSPQTTWMMSWNDETETWRDYSVSMFFFHCLPFVLCLLVSECKWMMVNTSRSCRLALLSSVYLLGRGQRAKWPSTSTKMSTSQQLTATKSRALLIPWNKLQ